MKSARELWRRAVAALRRGRSDREFEAERQAHLRLAADDLERRGVPPGEARRQARLSFGGQDAAVELQRDARGLPRLESFVRDFAYAWRGLRRDLGLACAAVLILAIGIGANTAVFSLVRPILLKPLPFTRADELVWIANTNTGGLSGATFQVDTYDGLRRRVTSIQDWTAYFAFSGFGNNTLVRRGDAEHVFIVDVAPRFFELLDVQPAIGRLFVEGEYQTNGPHAVLIDHAYWQRRFGSDPDLVGTTITINNQPALVVGVLPASFDFASVFAPGTRVDFFAPAILADMRPWGNTLAVVGRLAPGTSIDRTRDELAAAGPAVREAQPKLFPFGTNITPLQQHVSGSMRQPLSVLWGAVGLMTIDMKRDRADLLAEAVRRVRAIPGVTAAGVTDALPLDRNRSWAVHVPGHDYPNNRWPNAFAYVVGPGYLRAMGMSLIDGRDMGDTDTKDHAAVVVVSESLARVLYPGEDAVGKPAAINGQIGAGPTHTIVGVVADVRQNHLDEPSALQMYLPVAQSGGYSSDLVVRSSLAAGVLVPSVRRTLSSVDQTLLVTDARPATDLIDRSVSPRRLVVSLIGGFSLFALLLASLGIYGVVSYGVNQRVQEIGVRMALGATRGDVQRQVLAGALRLALAGVALGLAGALILSRIVASLLFDMSPTDAATFGWTALLLVTVAAFAAYLPAVRASRIPPMRALQGS